MGVQEQMYELLLYVAKRRKTKKTEIDLSLLLFTKKWPLNSSGPSISHVRCLHEHSIRHVLAKLPKPERRSVCVWSPRVHLNHSPSMCSLAPYTGQCQSPLVGKSKVIFGQKSCPRPAGTQPAADPTRKTSSRTEKSAHLTQCEKKKFDESVPKRNIINVFF